MIAILKYPAGNIRSVINALGRIGVEPVLTDDPELLRQASHVIIPGQGSAATTMLYLKEHGLDTLILSLRQPVLGICIGMQLMCRHSDEGDVDCLGIFDDAQVTRFNAEGIKIPHMGWNTICHDQSALFAGIRNEQHVYFVHSFRVTGSRYATALTNYGGDFVSALQKDNFYATQFHPEKSGDVGEQIIRNFINI